MNHHFCKRHLLSALIAMPVMIGMAQQVSHEEAAAVARQHFLTRSAQSGHRAPMRQEVRPRMVYAEEAAGTTAFYVFDNENAGGFIIVGGDAAVRPVLGYTDTGHFSIDSIPDNMRAWLEQLHADVCRAQQHDTAPYEATAWQARARAATRQSVQPLLKTQWGQSTPYNNAIAREEGKTSKFVTGCVATAMAQVMNYHQCPQTHGTGSHSFKRGYQSGAVTFAADFEHTTYDWAHMRNLYKNQTYTEAEAQAVAQLMYHAGVSVDMQYGYGSSGAYSADVVSALIKYFGYDKSTYEAQRSGYTDRGWEDLIYNELAHQRPVLYAGGDYQDRGAHEFVCDGYDATTDLYHFNWGWEGYCDGYYAITGVEGTGVLQPNGNGIGGAGEGSAYTRGQSAVIDALPDHGGSYHSVIETDSFSPTVDHMRLDSAYLFAGRHNFDCGFWVYNRTPYDIEYVELGLAFRNLETGEILAPVCTTQLGSSLKPNWPPQHWWPDFSCNPVTDDGDYELLPLYRLSADAKWEQVSYQFRLPRFKIIGYRSDVKHDVEFEISDYTVVERRQLQITHKAPYNGTLTYTSSDPTVATVDKNGIVTGVKEGRATISVKVTENLYFNGSVQQFDVTVTPFERYDITFSISDDIWGPLTPYQVGDTMRVLMNADYHGKVTYASSDETTATIDANGFIRAINDGETIITAIGEQTDDYNRTVAQMKLIIKPLQPFGLELTNFRIKNRGYVTIDDFEWSVDVTKVSRTPSKNLKFGYSYATGEGGTHYSYSSLSITQGQTISRKFNLNYKFLEEEIEQLPTINIGFCGKDDDSWLGASSIPFEGMYSYEAHLCHNLPIAYTLQDEWGTICLPYEAKVPAGLKVYASHASIDGYLLLEEVDYIEMGTPYIVHGTPGSYAFEGPDVPYEEAAAQVGLLCGAVKDGMTLQAGDYVLEKKSGTWGFTKVASAKVGTSVDCYTAVVRLDATSDVYNQYNRLLVTSPSYGDTNGDGHIDVGDLVKMNMQKPQQATVGQLRQYILEK